MVNIVLIKCKPSHITWEHRSYKIQTLTYNMANIVLIKYKPSHITWRTSLLTSHITWQTSFL